MARPLRLEFPGAVYHLTSRGNGRQKIVFTDTDRELFLGTLAHVVSRTVGSASPSASWMVFGVGLFAVTLGLILGC